MNLIDLKHYVIDYTFLKHVFLLQKDIYHRLNLKQIIYELKICFQKLNIQIDSLQKKTFFKKSILKFQELWP